MTALLLALATACLTGFTGRSSPAESIEKGRTFLVSLLDPELGLLPEYRGATVYWLFHDNYLAAKVLKSSHPEVARSIVTAMDREAIHSSGKIEIVFGETKKPFPFRQPELIDVRHLTNKVIRTERVTDRVLDGWKEYADLLMLASLAETNRSSAQQHWEAAMRLWDGHGFLDAAAKHDRRYSTYKLGLALLAGSRFALSQKTSEALLAKLISLQEPSGGWVTDYDETGKKLGVANVETTCLSILGLEAHTPKSIR